MSDARWLYTCHAGFDFPQTVCKRLILKRKWWNWQTHHLEGVAPKGVGVQIPPSAPLHLSSLDPEFELRLQRSFSFMWITVLITIVHVIVCLFLIAVVLLQSGKSGDLAAA